MKVVHKSKISFMAILLVFAMLAGIFPVGVFAEEDLVLSSEAGINEEYNESEGEETKENYTGTEEPVTEEETDEESSTLENQLTYAEQIELSKVDIVTAISDLAVGNETTEEEILAAAQNASLYEVLVSWSETDGFYKIDATVDARGSITGSLVLTLEDVSDYILVDKIIEKLPSPNEEEVSKEFLLMPMDIMTTSTNIITLPSESVDNSSFDFVPGVHVGTNDTLIYNGTETLTFRGGLQAAGIGGKGVGNGSNTVSADSFIGNVVFGKEGQVGGFKITAYGGKWAAGIGDGDTAESNTGLNPSRSITINSGIVIGYAGEAAGIGTQDQLTNTDMILDFKNEKEGSFAVGASSSARGIGAGTGASMKPDNLKVAGYVMGLATGANFPISENSTSEEAAIDQKWTIYSFDLEEGVGAESRIYVTKEGSDLPVYDYTIPAGYTKLALSLKVKEKYTILFGNQGYKTIQTITDNGGKFVNEKISPSSLGFATTVNLGSSMSLDTESGTLSQGGSAGATITPIKIKADNGYQLPVNWSIGNGLTYTRNTATTATIIGNIQNTNVIVTVPDATIVESGIQTSIGNSNYTINGDGVSIDPDLTIEDYSQDISGASVLIRNLKAGDKLNYTPINGISGTYNSNTGVLTLTGTTTSEKYQEALRSVTFSTTSSTADDRTIDFVLGSGLYFNDHFYEYVPGILTWGAAKDAAESTSLFGRQGYLVTITSQDENDFVSNKTQGLGWIGARDINRDLVNGAYLTGGLSNGDWRWVTGPEGLMDSGKGLKFYNGYVNNSPSIVSGQYNNWASGEPNNAPSEWVVHIYRKDSSTNSGKWNDFSPTNNSVQGYIVEYGGMPNDATINIQASKTIKLSIPAYSINYYLNGGTVSTANPLSYTSNDTDFTLINPTRSGHLFVGWSGTGLEGKTNQIVTINSGSTGDRSYTANWKAVAPTEPLDNSSVTSKTSSTITIDTQSVYEYSIDGTNWSSSSSGSHTFTELDIGTLYNIFYRVPAVTELGKISEASDSSPALSVRTKYAPTLSISVKPESATYPGNIEVVATLTGADNLGGKEIHFYDVESYLLKVTTDGNGKATFIALNPTPKVYSFSAGFGGDDNNMSTASNNLTFSVLKANQTGVTFENSDSISKTYGDDSFSLPDVSGGSGTGSYSYRSDNTNVATVSGNTVTITGAGESIIYVKKLGDNYYKDSEEVGIKVIVSKKNINISGMGVEDKEYDGNSFATIDGNNAVLVGVKNGDIVTIDKTNASASFLDAKVGEDKSVTFKQFTLSGEDAANYILESQPVNTSADITPRQVTVSGITAGDKVYDGNTMATLDLSNPSFDRKLEDDNLSITATGTFTSKDVQSDAIDVNISDFILGGDDAGNYQLSTTGQQATTSAKITPATIRVTPKSDQWKFYGQADPILEFDSIGAVTDETPAFTGSLSRETGEAISSNYAITLGSLSLSNNGTFLAQNYNLVFNDEPVDFEIKEYTTTKLATSTPNGENGWFKEAPITLNAPEGYMISTSNDLDGKTWTDSIILNDENGDSKDVAYYLRNTSTSIGAISTNKIYAYKVDKTLPSITSITGNVDEWQNTDITLTVYANDTGSGLAEAAYSFDGGKTWQSDNTYVYDSNQIINENTIKVKDLAGNISSYSEKITISKIDKANPETPTVMLDNIDPISGWYSRYPEIKIIPADHVEGSAPAVTYYKLWNSSASTNNVEPESGTELTGQPTIDRDGIWKLKVWTVDDAENISLSSLITIKIDTTPYLPPSSIVTVNGESISAGTEAKTIIDGKSTTIVKINNQVVNSKIEEAIKNNTTGGVNTIQIASSDRASEIVVFQLSGDTINNLEENAFNVSVKNNNIEYIIPAKELRISEVAKELNILVKDLKEIEVEIRIIKIDEKIIEKYNQMAKTNGVELIFSPVSFEVVAYTTGEDGSKDEVKISRFSNYVERVMEISKVINPSKVSTGIVFNTNGTYSHVPTEVYKKDGKWYAKINSLTNSDYSVIWNPVSVKSVENHWSKDTVSDLASRLIVFNPETFEPNNAITRADFAEYIVRALGLYREGSNHVNKFSDVKEEADRTLALLIASEYGIVTGYPDGTLRPDTLITREEAMTMYQRAMKVTKLVGTDSNRYQSYTDYNQVSSWATSYVKEVLSAHVFNGNTATTISPKTNLTYAEAAQAIKNLLVKSMLINK